MTRADRVLHMFEDQPSGQEVASSLLLSMNLVSIPTLMKEVQTAHGQEVGNQFADLVIRGILPSTKEPLYTFFKSRTDMISQLCANRLETIDNDSISS